MDVSNLARVPHSQGSGDFVVCDRQSGGRFVLSDALLKAPTPVPLYFPLVVTPEVAKWCLGRNINNRSIKEEGVKMLVRALKSGGFVDTAETIKFDSNGELIDGQHRLAAIIRADVSAPITLAMGLPPKAKRLIDTGSKRTPRDIMVLGDIYPDMRNHLKSLAAAVKLAVQFVLETSTLKLSVPEIEEAVKQLGTENVKAVLTECGRHGRKPGSLLTYAPFVAAMIFAHRLYPDQTIQFIERVASGAMLNEKDPELVLREMSSSRQGSVNDISHRMLWTERSLKAFWVSVNGQKCASSATIRDLSEDLKALFVGDLDFSAFKA